MTQFNVMQSDYSYKNATDMYLLDVIGVNQIRRVNIFNKKLSRAERPARQLCISLLLGYYPYPSSFVYIHNYLADLLNIRNLSKHLRHLANIAETVTHLIVTENEARLLLPEASGNPSE